MDIQELATKIVDFATSKPEEPKETEETKETKETKETISPSEPENPVLSSKTFIVPIDEAKTPEEILANSFEQLKAYREKANDDYQIFAGITDKVAETLQLADNANKEANDLKEKIQELMSQGEKPEKLKKLKEEQFALANLSEEYKSYADTLTFDVDKAKLQYSVSLRDVTTHVSQLRKDYAEYKLSEAMESVECILKPVFAL
ncbi:MAG: hypothetical protein ACOYMG_06870, partial [Candidatus Methylumidiphilus sp.]